MAGRMLAHRQSAELAKQLLAEVCAQQNIEPDKLAIHADRGSSMIVSAPSNAT